jgi:hypothetical protein
MFSSILNTKTFDIGADDPKRPSLPPDIKVCFSLFYIRYDIEDQNFIYWHQIYFLQILTNSPRTSILLISYTDIRCNMNIWHRVQYPNYQPRSWHTPGSEWYCDSEISSWSWEAALYIMCIDLLDPHGRDYPHVKPTNSYRAGSAVPVTCWICAAGKYHAFLSPAFLSPAFLSTAFLSPAFLSPAFPTPAFLSPAFLSPAFLYNIDLQSGATDKESDILHAT